jgi:hypothetical protein
MRTVNPYASVLLLSLTLASPNEMAELDRWIGLTLSEDGTEIKAAPNTIKPVMGDRVTMWTLSLRGPPRRLKNGEVATYGRSRWFADCSRNSLGLAEVLDYNDNGDVVLRFNVPQTTMENVRTESVAEIIFQFACNANFRAKQIEWFEDPINKPMPNPTSAGLAASANSP